MFVALVPGLVSVSPAPQRSGNLFDALARTGRHTAERTLDVRPAQGDLLTVSDPASTPAASPWTQLQSFRAAGVPRAEWLPRLLSTGLDPESARILLNSVDGPNPSTLPEPSFAPGINPLSTSLAFTEIGLSGAPVTVGLYWLAFGAAVLAMLAIFTMLVALDVVRLPELALVVLAWVMGPIALGSLGWGSWRLINAIRVRRRA